MAAMEGDDERMEREEEVAVSKTCLSSFLDDGSAESHRYYLSRRTLLEMLKDRGYLIPDSEINLSLQDFRAIHGQSPDTDRLRISASHQSHSSNKILAIFCGPGVVKVNVVRGIATQIANKESLSRLIVVVQDKITDQAMKVFDLFSFKVEIFQITDLLVNITKHELKPKHRVLTNEEKEELLKKYSLQEKQLPRIQLKDAIARYYALEKGQAMLNQVGYIPEISHGVLVEMAEHRKELEKKTEPILDTLRSYQHLPPDKALAALAIEDKKRQYAAAVKYLEHVLQSALATTE